MKIVNAEKILVDKLAEKCSENIDENKLIYNGTVNDYGNLCNSCTIWITILTCTILIQYSCTVLLVIDFLILISIGSVFIYFHWYLKRGNTYVNTSTNTDINRNNDLLDI